MRRRNSGMVLVIVLWAVVLLAVVCLALGGSVFLAQGQQRHRRGEVRVNRLTTSAAALAEAIILADDTRTDNLDEQWAQSSNAEALSLEQDGLVASLVIPNALPNQAGLLDESARLNANTASAEMLAKLPGMNTATAEAFVAARKRLAEKPDALLSQPKGTTGPLATPLQVAAVLGECFGQTDNSKPTPAKASTAGQTIWAPAAELSEQVAQVMQYLTVFTWQHNTDYLGRPRVNINTADHAAMTQALGEALSPTQIAAIIATRADGPYENIAQLLTRQLWILTAHGRVGVPISIEEFQKVADRLTVSKKSTLTGLVNINTCCEQVLTAIPGISTENAAQIVLYREFLGDADEARLAAGTSWLLEVLSPGDFEAACPFVTTRSQQFRAYVQIVQKAEKTAKTTVLPHYSMMIFERSAGTSRRLFRMDWRQPRAIFDN